MVNAQIDAPAFVVKVEELGALNHLPEDHPRPLAIDWINRGTDKKLKPSSIDMLLRTLYVEIASPSVVKLHRSSGLRIAFREESERNRFASAFRSAKERLEECSQTRATAIFDSPDAARKATDALQAEGVPEKAISLLWRSNLFLDRDIKWPEGHSKLSVAGAVAGGGLAGTMFAIGILVVPGIGPVIAAGALASAVLPAVASLGGVAGATGGAIARMLSDHDVDGVAAAFYEQQIKRGKVFVAVDTRELEMPDRDIRQILGKAGGKISVRA